MTPSFPSSWTQTDAEREASPCFCSFVLDISRRKMKMILSLCVRMLLLTSVSLSSHSFGAYRTSVSQCYSHCSICFSFVFLRLFLFKPNKNKYTGNWKEERRRKKGQLLLSSVHSDEIFYLPSLPLYSPSPFPFCI